MSSEISTDPRVHNDHSHADEGLQPWQFFVLTGLACASAATFLARGQGVTVVLLLTALMGATALVGPADAVLVKASRGVRLETVVDALVARFGRGEGKA